MDTAAFSEDVVEKNVFIVGSELVENYTVYIIEVTVGNHKWTIKHRYSDFHDLHEKLTAEKKVDKHLLPPKKIIGKNSKSLVEKRQKELEVYLQTLLVTFPVAAPKALSCFLHFHQYEITGITAALAEELFHKGEQLLVAGEVFTLRPLQLYAITQQLKLAKPTCSNGDAKADLGHILDFTCRLKYLKITGSQGVVGTSNIQEDCLTFDLFFFKALLQIEISDCKSSQIVGLPSLKPCLATLNVHHTVSSMMDLLVPEASEFPLWVAEGVATDSPVTTIIPTWKTLTTLDMSHNHIRCIDDSVKLIREVEFLDLSHNELSAVDHLQHLYNLVHLDLSYNSLTVLEGVHTKLGNIKTLNLAGNQIDSLAGLSRLYSLVNLDLSSNKLGQLEEIRHIGPLPCLERLSLADNPMCIVPDYRTKVLAQFWDRVSEVCLDNTSPTEQELDTVEVLKAIQKAKEAKDRMANQNQKKISEDPRSSVGGSHKLPSSSLASTASASTASAPASSASTASACPSQDVIWLEDDLVPPEILTPVDFALNTPRCYNDVNTMSCEEQVTCHQLDEDSSFSFKLSSLQSGKYQTNTSCSCMEDRAVGGMLNYSNLKTSLLPLHLLSCSSTCSAFTSLLSKRIKALGEKEDEKRLLRDLVSQEGTCLGSPSTSSGDGYFEMGLGKGEPEGDGPASPTSLSDKGELEVQGENRAPVEPEEEEVVVTRLSWCLCLRVGDMVEQRFACVVLTDRLLALFHLPAPQNPLIAHCGPPHHLPHLADMIQPDLLPDLVDMMETDVLLAHDQINSVLFDIPDTCLSLRVKGQDVVWFLFSDSESLKATHSSICSSICPLAQLPSCLSEEPSTSQQLLRLLLTSWEFEENQDCVKGGYVAHLVETSTLSPTATDQTSTLPTNQTSTPSTNQTSTTSTNQTSTTSTPTNQTSTLSTNQTSTPSTNQTSTPSTNQTSTHPTNQTSTLPTNQTSTPSTNQTSTNQTSTLSSTTKQTTFLRTSSNSSGPAVPGPTSTLSATPLNPTNPRLSDILSHVVPGGETDRDSCCLPSVLFLTQLHVYVLKVDFPGLARGSPRDQPDHFSQRLRSWARLTRLPLASVLLHPKLSVLSGSPRCPLLGHQLSTPDGHVLELLLGQERVTVSFPLPQDRLRFQKQFSTLRSSLRDIKTVAFLHGCNEYDHGDSEGPRAINVYTSCLRRCQRTDYRLQVNSPGGARGPSLSLSYPTEYLLEKLTEDNHVPPHLSPYLSPAQSHLSGLRAPDLLRFFHTNISEVEKEELQHIMWSSVVFYKSPDIEITSCIMLSTKALYFLLDDSASTLIDQSPLWNWSHCDRLDPELIMSFCFTMKLNDLQSINVGLFDQYFRVVGPSAENIICCLTRDSYGTHGFLQQLMSVLSLQEKLPSPEPSEQDFYTQFGNNSSGKMKNYEMVHSRVKFIYPSEEEIGDLTFIVAERKGPFGASSCNILLYVLVFQVQNQNQAADCSGTKTRSQIQAAEGHTSTGGLHGDRKSLPPQSPVSASQPRLYSQGLPSASPLPSRANPQGLPSASSLPSRANPQGLPLYMPLLHPKTLVITSTDVFLLDEDYISYPLPDFAKEPPHRDKYHLTDARRIRDLDRVLMGYQTYPQALTLVFDDVPGPDLLCHLTMDHFGDQEGAGRAWGSGGAESEVQWCVYVPGAECRERLICLLARQWEGLCSRELPVELTG
ncbi:hypothetical protein DPEC_G00249270 [Dallia pectoralis]|uniref:Uncharacterized protein n=1 Tax=Dallia pectoralis TaxID=75939 RepID=A0ACC2FSX3_DALPE|nr:hypothetical protein DPEC_G00249270 [Dallia pectoralis]